MVVVATDKWICENVEAIFEYALQYLTDCGDMTPKLHMVNKSGKTGIITCDFWDRDDKDRDFVELAKLLEDLGTKFDAIANILVFVGKLNGTEVIGQLCYGSGTPILYTKPVIRGPVIDFGPVTTTVWNEVKNLQF